MAKFSCSNASRYIVVLVNVAFIVMGIIIMITGFVAYGLAQNVESSAIIFRSLQVSLIAELITITGLMTIAISLTGCYGAYMKDSNYLKFYAVSLFIVCCIQLGMGAYLMSLNVDSLYNTWAQDDTQGEEQREDYENYMHCCGWDWVTDSMPETPCDGYRVTCKQATQNWLNSHMASVAAAAVGIAVVELVSLIATCIIIATSGKKSEDFYDSPFSY